MDVIHAIIIGLVQGLTEFLPISSSGHIFLLTDICNWGDPGAGFTAVIQLGTMLAVLIYFYKDILKIAGGFFRGFSKPDSRGLDWKMGWAVIIGTIPIAVLGLAFQKQIESTLRTAWVVAVTLIFFALVLWVAEIMGKRKRDANALDIKDGIIVGLWQALALIPGSSRSGCTITGGLFLGLDRETAARFSFLLSIPAVVVSGLYELIKYRHELLAGGMVATVVATVVAFVTGYAAIAFLMKFLQTKSTMVFVFYRLVLGAIVIGLILTGVAR